MIAKYLRARIVLRRMLGLLYYREESIYALPWNSEDMRTYIFTDRERLILEAQLTGAKVDSIEVSKIMHRIRKFKILFEDVYLYLRARKTMTTTPT